MNDPSRMAANCAGVSSNEDARNDIIIRGNSPLGASCMWLNTWMEIPNPNHFVRSATTGTRPVSMLNNNSTDKSDFLTGASAEYGTRLPEFLICRMRSGNNEKWISVRFGSNGSNWEQKVLLEKRSPSLFHYRYPTLAYSKHWELIWKQEQLYRRLDISLK